SPLAGTDFDNRFIWTRRNCGDNSIDDIAIDEKILTKAAFGGSHWVRRRPACSSACAPRREEAGGTPAYLTGGIAGDFQIGAALLDRKPLQLKRVGNSLGARALNCRRRVL